MEAYSGSRPARPGLLLLLCTGTLVVTLALAAVQVQASRSLGSRVRIEGAPISVQPPRGWQADPNDPLQFRPPADRSVQMHEADIFRRVIYRYSRRPAFVPPDTLLRELDIRGGSESLVRSARLAGLDGLEAVRVRNSPYGTLQTLLRLACSPRGDVLLIEYWPLAELDPGDLALMDRLAAAVQFDQTHFETSAETLLRSSGIRFEVPSDWQLVGPDFNDIPGFYVLGSVQNQPVYALMVMRTWLAHGRTPEAVLADTAAIRWQRPITPLHLRQQDRSDGVQITAVVHPDGPRPGEYPVLRIVSNTPGEALFIAATADAEHAGAADAAAQWLAENVRFERPFPDVEASSAAGAGLVARIASETLEAWWSRGGQSHYAMGKIEGADLIMGASRAFTEGAGTPEYVGHELAEVNRGSGELYEENWRTSLDGGEYEYVQESGPVRDRRRRSATRQRRTGGADLITFTIGSRAQTVPVGPAFLSPPVQSVAQAIVAHESAGDCLIESPHPRGVGVHTRLLRPLTPDPQGRRRLLVIADYWPEGEVVARDRAGDLLYYLAPAIDIREVSEADALRASRYLHNLD
jgi:hypothetical protein